LKEYTCVEAKHHKNVGYLGKPLLAVRERQVSADKPTLKFPFL